MSLPRYAKRRDATEPAIVKDLRKCGFLVRQQDFPDLIVRRSSWPAGVTRLLEVDGITKNRQRKEKQLEFLRDWNIPIVKTFEDALKAIGAP
jgi:hypothetical protein